MFEAVSNQGREYNLRNKNIHLMKLFGLLIICITLSAQLDAVIAKSCRGASHCRPEECCMTKSSMLGSCRELGCEGSSCQPNNYQSHLGDMYLMSCPCVEGLKCIPGSVHKNPTDGTIEYINSTCRKSEEVVQLSAEENTFKLPVYLQRLINDTYSHSHLY